MRKYSAVVRAVVLDVEAQQAAARDRRVQAALQRASERLVGAVAQRGQQRRLRLQLALA